jgi:transmembrane sensor
VRETSSQIDETAAVWALRSQAGALSHEQDVELQGWLQSDSRHFGAYTRAMGVLVYFDRAAALKSGRSAMIGAGPPAMTRRRWLQAAGAAACLGGFTAVTSWTWNQLRARISSRKGEVRMVALKDGSQVALDTQSTVQMAFSPKRRGVRLLAGDALFDVAKDPARPFVVAAGNTRVRAVGTSFSVQLLPHDQVRVLVREGRVEVTHNSAGDSKPRRLVLSANMSTLTTDAPVMTAVSEPAEAVERQLAWRNGMLDFDAVSLDQAAAQFARYSDYALQVDPDVANERVTGRFRAADARGFAKAAAESLGLTAEFGEQTVSLHR